MRFSATRTVADTVRLPLHEVLERQNVQTVAENNIGAGFCFVRELENRRGLTLSDKETFVVHPRLHYVLEPTGGLRVPSRLIHRVGHQANDSLTGTEARHNAG